MRDYLGVERSFKDYYKFVDGSNHSNNGLIKHRDDSKEIICYAYKQPGHKSSDCPTRARVENGEGNLARRVKGKQGQSYCMLLMLRVD